MNKLDLMCKTYYENITITVSLCLNFKVMISSGSVDIPEWETLSTKAKNIFKINYSTLHLHSTHIMLPHNISSDPKQSHAYLDSPKYQY